MIINYFFPSININDLNIPKYIIAFVSLTGIFIYTQDIFNKFL
jgi:hypothetical protein